MPIQDKWFERSIEPQLKMVPFNDIDEHQKDYEDPDYYYSKPPELGQTAQQQLPPPLPPPMTLPPKIAPFHYSLRHIKKRKTRNWKVIFLGVSLSVVSFLLLASIISLLLLRPKTYSSSPTPTSEALLSNTAQLQKKKDESRNDRMKINSNALEMTPNYLLTLLITKRRLCVLETGTDDDDNSWKKFSAEHIELARMVFFSNLSHSGAPVHPLQFQRYVRSLGVDDDCQVVLYDRGDSLWATYAFWIFTLFGHTKVSVLSGGFEEWKRLQGVSEQYHTESGNGAFVQRQGNFHAQWKPNVICTFDDVLVNSELKTYDLVDAQDRQEYNGSGQGAVFGHIRSAVNVPLEGVFSWRDQRWSNTSSLVKTFSKAGLLLQRPVIVYSSTTVRSSMIWFALRKCGYNATIYIGSWPEWIIKAPDFLKIIPEQQSSG